MSEATKLKIVFMGTPDFAASIVQCVSQWQGGEVMAVYCQPDRPAGRGHKLQAPPVKEWALSRSLPVFQPVNFKAEEDRQILAAFAPDVLVVAAYGLLLPQSVLDIPRLGPINVHGSLLPAYRGAAPIQRAIMDGCAETGVSIMRMEAGLDSGPVYAMRSLHIGAHTTGSMHEALAELGGQVLVEVLEDLRLGRALLPQVQEHAHATHAPKMRKEEGQVRWNRSVLAVDAQIRAVTPWPGAQARFLSQEKGLFDLRIAPGTTGPQTASYAPYAGCGRSGQLWRLEDGRLGVSCSDAFYILTSVRPLNKKEMSATDFANGHWGKQKGLLAEASDFFGQN